MFEVGDRVIQIPLDWPSRQGTVATVSQTTGEISIQWDDGRKDWVHVNDLGREHIWLVKPPEPAVAPI